MADEQSGVPDFFVKSNQSVPDFFLPGPAPLPSGKITPAKPPEPGMKDDSFWSSFTNGEFLKNHPIIKRALLGQGTDSEGHPIVGPGMTQIGFGKYNVASGINKGVDWLSNKTGADSVYPQLYPTGPTMPFTTGQGLRAIGGMVGGWLGTADPRASIPSHAPDVLPPQAPPERLGLPPYQEGIPLGPSPLDIEQTRLTTTPAQSVPARPVSGAGLTDEENMRLLQKGGGLTGNPKTTFTGEVPELPRVEGQATPGNIGSQEWQPPQLPSANQHPVSTVVQGAVRTGNPEVTQAATELLKDKGSMLSRWWNGSGTALEQEVANYGPIGQSIAMAVDRASLIGRRYGAQWMNTALPIARDLPNKAEEAQNFVNGILDKLEAKGIDVNTFLGDTDPLKDADTLVNFTNYAARKLGQAEELGGVKDLIANSPNKEELTRLVNRMVPGWEYKGDSWVRELMSDTTSAASKMAAWLHLSKFAIRKFNTGIPLIMRSELGDLAGSLRDVFTKAGFIDDMNMTGANHNIGSTILDEIEADSNSAGVWGVRSADRMGRVVAAGAGKGTAKTLFERLKSGRATDMNTKERLRNLILENPDEVLKQDALTDKQLDMAGARMSEMTQGLPEARKVPYLWSEPMAQLPLIFKKFAFQHGKMMKDAILEGGSGLQGFQKGVGIAKKVAVAGALSQVFGEVVGDTVSGLMGAGLTPFNDKGLGENVSDRILNRGSYLKPITGDHPVVNHLIDNISASWVPGVALEMLESLASPEKAAAYILGPGITDPLRLGADALMTGAQFMSGNNPLEQGGYGARDLGRFLISSTPGIGSAELGRTIVPPMNQGTGMPHMGFSRQPMRKETTPGGAKADFSNAKTEDLVNLLRTTLNNPSSELPSNEMNKFYIPRKDVGSDEMTIPTAAPFRQPPEIRGDSTGMVNRQANEFLRFAPQLRGRIPNITFGPNKDVMNVLDRSNMDPEQFQDSTLLGTTSSKDNAIALNPSLRERARGFDDSLPEVMGHEFTHASGQNRETLPQMMELVIRELNKRGYFKGR